MDPNVKDSGSEHVDNMKAEEGQNVAAIHMPADLAVLSDEEYKKLGRKATFKLDIVIMPILVIMYILNYLDRQSIASAKLAGIEAELNLSPVQYQTSVSILFCSYILFQIPSNMIAGRIKWPATYICISMALWGVVSAAVAEVHNFSGLVAARFMLGLVESTFFPGALYFLSMFYNRKQYAFRCAILYSGSQLGNAFGGLFAIGILKLDGHHGISGWRWLFLVEGVITVGLAIIFAFILPNSNTKVMGLTPIEHQWIQWNYASDLGQEDNNSEEGAWGGFVMALKDPKTYLFTGILYCTYIVGAVSNFFPSVVGGLGFDRNTTYLLTAPPFLLCVICMLLNGLHSDRTSERSFHIMVPLVISLVANIIAVSSLNIGARYTAMMLLPASFYASAVVTLSWIAGSLSQPKSKRAAGIAMVNAICNTPNIWCSYLYYSPPRYLTAFIVNVVASGLAIAFAFVTRIYLKRQNARLDSDQPASKHGPTAAQIVAGFRYTL